MPELTSCDDICTSLDLSGDSNLTSLPENIPRYLISLDLSNCPKLKRLPENLPVGLTTLQVSGCLRLTDLPENLPTGLTTLDLSGCERLTHLPDNLPDGLVTLNLGLCTRLTHLPDHLPTGLTTLRLNQCSSLTYLPQDLPVGLAMLDLGYCSKLSYLPDNLPAGLTSIGINECTSLIHLPENLPERITTLSLRACSSLTNLPENIPAGLTELDLSWCACLTHLGTLHASLLVKIEPETNYSLLTLSSDCKARFEIGGTRLPQFLPQPVASSIDTSYPSGIIAARLAWALAIDDASMAVASDLINGAASIEHTLWLQSLSHLQDNPSVWDHPPCLKLKQRLQVLFDQSLKHYLALPMHTLLQEGGDVGAAVAALHGSTLSAEEQMHLAITIKFDDTEASPTEKINVVIGLKSSAFYEARQHLAKVVGGGFQMAGPALRLILTFGKSWRSWLNSRVRAVGQHSSVLDFIHDASFWLPMEPVAKLSGLSDWLFDVRHRCKPVNMLDIIARNWSSLDDAARRLPYQELLALLCQRSYPEAGNGRFLMESATWGTAVEDYAQMEKRFISSWAIPSPFPTEGRWVLGGLVGRFLPRDDARGIYLGNHTNCCQHPYQAARSAAWYGQEKSNAGFFVVEDRHGDIVAQSFAWISGNGGLCFDSVESKGPGKQKPAVVDIYKLVAQELSTTFHTITLGKGTNKLDAEQYWSEASYERLSLPECDQSDEPYSDSSIQFILAYNPKLAKTTVSNLIK